MNLQANSLNNVRIGDSYEKLQAFGRPNNSRPFKNDFFGYHSLGMEIRGERGKVKMFYFIFKPSEELIECDETLADYALCELTLITGKGGYLAINEQTTVSDVERAFGSPVERDIDDNYISLIYRCDNLGLDFTFGGDKYIESLHVSSWD